ncbi:hypothetical protein GEA64_07225 [Photorhabdus khanii]|uniref:Pentapeptide repeat-containing protein n=1 Tax=Photorhabdus khanii TaxID=1004150 RepID=A0A7C9KCE5_9GAMM|nr:hypothetical protein [Photorhabdus khanii]MQL47781.1 hypothetical protein [Photorhabdus khanii]
MGSGLRLAYFAKENLDDMSIMAANLSNVDLYGVTLFNAGLTNISVNDCKLITEYGDQQLIIGDTWLIASSTEIYSQHDDLASMNKHNNLVNN